MGRDFYERFDLRVDTVEARRRFINRTSNEIFDWLWDKYGESRNYSRLRRAVATALGEEDRGKHISTLVAQDFPKCLLSLEAVYSELGGLDNLGYLDCRQLEKKIQTLLDSSETDLAISWKKGKFFPKGAELLDDRLINDPLKWLREKGYDTVIQPYEKALQHFLESEKRPELLADVITDAYEALEAMAKITTKRDDDLSSTQEQFLKVLELGKEYRRVLDLKQYVVFGCIYRHGAKKDAPKPNLTPREVEAFLYQTGIYLRLATSADADK